MGRLDANLVRSATRADHQTLTFSVAEKDVGGRHIPAPVLVDSGNVWLTGIHVVERLVTPGLLLREREIGWHDVHRIVWVCDLVIPKLGAILPRPRVLQKPDEFSWDQGGNGTHDISQVRTTASEHSIIIDFSNGGHKCAECDIDALSDEKTFRRRTTLQIAGLQAVAERHDSS